MLKDSDLKALVELRLEADGTGSSIHSLVQDIRKECWLDLRTTVNCALYGLMLVRNDPHNKLSLLAANLKDKWDNRNKEGV